jgi:hypothetical protein
VPQKAMSCSYLTNRICRNWYCQSIPFRNSWVVMDTEFMAVFSLRLT